MAQMQREKPTRGGISLQLADFVPCKKGITFFRVMWQTVIRARLRMHYARRVSITSPVMMDTISKTGRVRAVRGEAEERTRHGH